MYQFYLSGGISDLSFGDACKWREIIENTLRDLGVKSVFNPVKHFTLEDVENGKITDQQIMDFELHALRISDCLIVNFNDPHSKGTLVEMAIAYERNIPILGLMEDVDIKLHPWQENMCLKIFDNIEDLTAFINKHYL